jgi:hypothetical protein
MCTPQDYSGNQSDLKARGGQPLLHVGIRDAGRYLIINYAEYESSMQASKKENKLEGWGT